MRKSLGIAWIFILLFSFDASATTEPPTNVQASIYTFTDKITVSWTPADGSQYFQVWRRENNTGNNFVAITSWIQGSSFDDTTVIPGVYYDYKVSAASLSDGSDASSLAGDIAGMRALIAPTDVQASDGTAGEIYIKWAGSSGRVDYAVFRSLLPSGGSMSLLTITGVNSYTDVTVDPVTTYYYFIKAVPARYGYDIFPQNNSALSPAEAGWALVKAPVLYQYGSGSESTVSFSWNDLNLSYRLFRGATQDINDARPLTDWAKFSTFTDTTARLCVDYYYFLKAALSEQDSIAEGKSAISQPVHVFESLRATTVSASDGTFTDNIEIKWNPVAGAVAYKLYRSATSSFATAQDISGWINETIYEDPMPIISTSYYYWVKAATVADDNLDAKFTSISAPNFGSSRDALGAPPSFSVSASIVDQSIRVSWTTSGLDVKYKVYRNTVPDQTTGRAITDWISDDHFVDNSVIPLITYYYFVKSSYTVHVEDGLYVTWTDLSKAITLPIGTFNIVASKEISTHYVAIAWPALPRASYYMVFRSDVVNAQQMSPITGWFEGTTFYDSAAAAGAPLNYGVQAATAAFVLIAQSSTDVGIRKIERPVINVTKNGGADKITWETVDGANYYKVYRALGASDTTTMEVVKDWAITDEYLTGDVQDRLYFYFVRAARNFLGDSPSFLSKGVSHNANVITGLGDDINEIKIYPNPSKGMVNLQAPSAIEDLSIVDMNGRSLKVEVDYNRVDVSGLAAGLYMIRGKCGDRPFAVKIIRSAD